MLEQVSNVQCCGRWIIVCSILFVQPIYAHKEPTHQYIIREAYSLLKKHLGKSIPEFDYHILGIDGMGREGEFHDSNANPWAYSTLCGGAWSEDHHDPIRYMHEKELLFKKGMFTSINHFWDPDQQSNGFNNRFELHIPWNPWPTGLFQWNICSLARTYSSDIEHDLMAYKKAMIYLSSNNYSPRLHESFTFTHDDKEFPSPGHFEASLFDWYHGDFKYDDVVVESNKKSIIYSILGRVAHLLGDMSIPAHAKCDEHGLWHDPYEDAMNYVEWEGNKESPCIDMNKNIPASTSRVEYWDHQKVFCDKGSIVLPSCTMFQSNPFWTYFYTTAQIADHFASNRFDGDDEYLHVGEIASVINGSHTGPTKTHFVDGHPALSGYARRDEDINAIRDMTFPYVIRATAGLLYQIALDFSLINPTGSKCPTILHIQDGILSGPHYVFESSDSIIIGDIQKPLFITSKVKHVKITANNVIKFNPQIHVQSGATLHAKNEECTSCYDDAPGIAVKAVKEHIDDTQAEFKLLSTWQDEKNIESSCCKSDPIISLRCMNDKGEILLERGKEYPISESNINSWIESQKSGIYAIKLESMHGKKEMRIIARL